MALDPAVFEGLSGVRRALRRFLAGSEQLCKASGISMQQYQALLAIKARQGGDMSVGKLAEELLLTHHGAVQMMDRLAQGGLARRQPSESDRRVALLVLTAAGEALVESLARQHLREILAQATQLRTSLDRLEQVAPSAAKAQP